MTNTKRLCAMLAAVALVLLFGLTGAEAQLAKKGTYSGVFGWHFPVEEVIEVEKDHFVWGGIARGAFRNDAGEGFLHGTSVVCTASGESNKGSQTHHYGDCVVTDKDGDKAILTWKCTACPGKPAGDMQWTGGTGKYAGLKGGNSYQETSAGPGVGWSVWKGE